ncbi:MAG: RNA methyltransferase substrate-binding domain-containing protein, partial [Oscillospiraceae bacterium]
MYNRNTGGKAPFDRHNSGFSQNKQNENKTSLSASDDDNDDDSLSGVLIVGRNPVIEALKSDKVIDTLYINPESGGSISLIIKMAHEKSIVIKNVSDTKLSYMSHHASHQGVIASCGCAEYVLVEDILEIAKEKNEQPFIIICDEIEDPHNLGAIIRTAEASGAHGIIIP